jgi:hypothetical protein
MPANLTPQFYEARERFHRASTNDDKVKALEEMLRTIPKHKGTDKMQANIKKQLSKVKADSIKQASQGKQKPFWIIDKQGAARIVLVGAANTGKSSFLQAVTNAKSTIADYPFTTQKPIPGMAIHKHVQFQIIDLPPYNSSSPGWMNEVIRTSDLILMFLDMSSDNVLSQLEETINTFKGNNINIISPLETEDVEEEIDDEELFIDANSRNTIIIGNKFDSNECNEIFELFLEYKNMLEVELPIHNISCTENLYINDLLDNIFNYLHIIRAYTKAPGTEPNFEEPVALRKGATLIDLAMEIHKDFANKLNFAKVWGKNTFDGQKVSKDYVICDGDIVEFHI